MVSLTVFHFSNISLFPPPFPLSPFYLSNTLSPSPLSPFYLSNTLSLSLLSLFYLSNKLSLSFLIYIYFALSLCPALYLAPFHSLFYLSQPHTQTHSPTHTHTHTQFQVSIERIEPEIKGTFNVALLG